MKFNLEVAYPEPVEQTRKDVVDFWLANGALDDRESAVQRAGELVVVARDLQGSVAGVSTCMPMFIERLGFKCFFYRSFIGKSSRSIGLRGLGLARKILIASHAHLNERFVNGIDSDVLGLYLQVESDSIRRNRNELIWTDEGMNVVYIGQNQHGHHLRVYYFDGARLNGPRR